MLAPVAQHTICWSTDAIDACCNTTPSIHRATHDHPPCHPCLMLLLLLLVVLLMQLLVVEVRVVHA
jgi:hypothetical protein